LLTRRAVAGLHRADDAADADILGFTFGVQLAQLREYLGQGLRDILARLAAYFVLLYLFRASDIRRVFYRQRELGELQRIRAVGRGLARRDELVGRRDRVVYDRSYFEQQVVGQRRYYRPVGDVR